MRSPRCSRFAIVVLTVGAWLVAAVPFPAGAFVAPSPPAYVSSFAGYADAQGVATDALGNLFVVDRYNGLIQRYDALGNWVTSWAAPSSPIGIATDPAGNVYVSSNFSFTPFTSKYTNSGVALGVAVPGNSGVATDASGNVFTSNHDTDQIFKSNSAGAVLTSWGGYGGGPGQFAGPRGLAVDAAGFVYVADVGNNRVQKFANDGTYVTQWGTAGSGNGQFSAPADVAIDAVGNVYVVDDNNRVQRFTKDGIYLDQWGTYGGGNGQFSGPTDIDVTPGGDIYVSDHNNGRVQRFSASGRTPAPAAPATYVTQWAVPNGGPHGVGHVYGIPEIYATAGDSWGSFSETGGTISWTTSNGLVSPGKIRPDPLGGPFVCFQSTHFSNYGSCIVVAPKDNANTMTVIDAPSSADFALDYFGHLFVLDPTANLVLEYNVPGVTGVTIVRQWGGSGSGSGQFTGPRAIACYHGLVYVLDSGNQRIQVFNRSGSYLSQVANPLLSGCSHLEIDDAGNFYCYDTTSIRMFAWNGTFLGSWGSPGNGNGQFSNVSDFCAGDSGYVYVADSTHANVQKFLVAPPPQILIVSDVGPDQGGSVRIRFRGTSADSSGSLVPITSYRVDRLEDATATWAELATVPATSATEYLAAVATPATAGPTAANYFAYRVRALTSDPLAVLTSPTAYGASVDNTPPPPPTGFISQLSGGTVYFEWTANPVADLAGYRLYKGSSSSFFPLPASLIGSTTVERFYFPGTPSDYFKLVAVDVNGNESTPVPNVAGTVGVPVPEAPQFALHGAGANPARGGRLAVMFSLPDRRAACLEVCDVAGRLLRVQDVESFGPGTHTLDLSNGGRMPAGLYFVRLTQGGNRRSIRITVLD